MKGETIVVRLGELAKPLEKMLAKTGEKKSDYVRRLIAADLGIEPPPMDGNLKTLKQFATKPKRKK